MELQPNAREASLSQALRYFGSDAAAVLTALVERLAALYPNAKIDWSDSWSDEDLREATAASMGRFEAEESEEGY
jgi:hypothetical protein